MLHDNMLLQVVYAYMYYTAYCYSTGYTSMGGYGYAGSIGVSVGAIVGQCYWQCLRDGRDCDAVVVLGACVRAHVMLYVYCGLAYVFRGIYYEHRQWFNGNRNGVYRYADQHRYRYRYRYGYR